MAAGQTLSYLVDLDYNHLVRLSEVNSMPICNHRCGLLDDSVPFEGVMVADGGSNGVLLLQSQCISDFKQARCRQCFPDREGQN